jgi:hypothetical protein
VMALQNGMSLMESPQDFPAIPFGAHSQSVHHHNT